MQVEGVVVDIPLDADSREEEDLSGFLVRFQGRSSSGYLGVWKGKDDAHGRPVSEWHRTDTETML
jgi:hypothetical protein